jgi:hypothetical protein
MPVVLATQEAELRRIMVQSQPGQTVHRPYLKNKKIKKSQKKGGWWNGSRCKFKSQSCKKKKKERKKE